MRCLAINAPEPIKESCTIMFILLIFTRPATMHLAGTLTRNTTLFDTVPNCPNNIIRDELCRIKNNEQVAGAPHRPTISISTKLYPSFS